MQITYKQLLDFTIGVLYELRVKNKRTGYFSLNEIVKYFDYEINYDEIKDLAKYLEALGYVKSMYTFGDAFIELTTRGIIYFEEKEKDKEFLVSFEKFVKTKVQKEKIKDTVEKLDKDVYVKSKQQLIDELNNFKFSVKNNEGDSEVIYHDFLLDIDIIISELNKNHPDNEILAHKSNSVLDYPKFKDKLSNIISKLNLQ